MPQGIQEISSQRTMNSSSVSPGSTVKSHVSFESSQPAYNTQYHGAEAWWSVGEFLKPGITHQSVRLSLTPKQDEEVWDLSDSLADLYQMVNEREKQASDQLSCEVKESKAGVDRKWIEKDTSNGFVTVYNSDLEVPKLVPCTLSTTAHKVCLQCGRPPNSLHIQLNGDIIRRLEPFDCPLAIQNEYLQRLGYTEIRKIQEMGLNEDLRWLVKFYAGKPVSDSTYSRNQLQTYAYVRKGKLIYQWVRRLCIISGTRLLIYRDKNKNSKPTTVQLAKGSVEEVSFKGHDRCLRLTSTLQGDRSVYLSFTESSDYSKWIRKAKKATAKLPSKADLTNCHLEFLPETVFINEDLKVLNLRHNALKERPIEEDIYTIGWLDDLPRFSNLSSLNLADNDLHSFPTAVCKIKTLMEINLSTNKIPEIPAEISELTSLKILHIHNNYLTSLPLELVELRLLQVIVLAFNHYTSVPEVLLNIHNSQLHLDSIIMAGNRVERLPHETLCKMQHIRKIDFRMNNLLLLPSETAKFHFLELVTHMDIRDNQIKDLDVRALKALEYLNCERNGMSSLQVNGMSLKTLLANNNELEVFAVNPKPEWLITLEISRNKLISLPTWLSECFFMVKLDASHNCIKELPERLFVDARKLKVLYVNHNQLSDLPGEVTKCMMEEIHLEHNNLTMLPGHLMLKAGKLRYLNLTQNNIAFVPQFSFTHDSRLQELYLSGNKLEDDSIPFICSFTRLKVLHIAHNRLTEIKSRDFTKLETLQELNTSGNDLRSLPSCLGKHNKLQVLRANSNHLKELPDFKRAANLKVLEVGSNRLSEVSLTHLMASQVHLLDISGNPNIMVNSTELKGISNWKKICMVDMRGQNRSLLDLRQAPFESGGYPWQTGLSLTSGTRNKLSVAIMNKPHFTNDGEGLFGVFDGGRNDEVTKILMDIFPDIVLAESQDDMTGQQYLKYSFLAAHSKLKETGQRLSAAVAMCHLKRNKEGYVLNVANVGDTEVVLCRRGEAVRISRRFDVQSDQEECQRICKSHGIITEDGKINGVTHHTRQLGNNFLYPHIIPNPHITSINLHADDQLIIIANQGLWSYMSYQDAVKQIHNVPDPVVAAKRLQDLAQGYGSKESIGVLVIRLILSEPERNRLKNILQKQYNAEQELLAAMKERDDIREDEKKKRRDAAMHEEEMIPMDIVKLKKQKKRRMQAYNVFNEEAGDYVSLSVDPENDSLTWEVILQKRLTEEIKDREMKHIFNEKDEDIMNMAFERGYNGAGVDENLNDKKKKVTKESVRGAEMNSGIIAPEHYRPTSLIETSPSLESMEFTKEYGMSMTVDRDAVLFHQMQIARSKSKSTDSIDSTQSVPTVGSYKEIPVVSQTSSHSIEVLFHKPENYVEDNFGGSHLSPLNRKKTPQNTKDNTEVSNSCPGTTAGESVVLQKLERTAGDFVGNITDKDDGNSDMSDGKDFTSVHSDPHVRSDNASEIAVDTSIVSAYKTSPTFKDKKIRAPDPPAAIRKLSPNRSQYHKEKRAPPPPVSYSAAKYLDNVVPSSNNNGLPLSDETDKNKSSSGKLLQGDVLNIRATFSCNSSSNSLKDFSSNAGKGNVKSADNKSKDVVNPMSTSPSLVGHVPHVVSSSVTSLENFYYNMNGQQSTNNSVNKSPSVETLVHLSLSQQSVIETYL